MPPEWSFHAPRNTLSTDEHLRVISNQGTTVAVYRIAFDFEADNDAVIAFVERDFSDVGKIEISNYLDLVREGVSPDVSHR